MSRILRSSRSLVAVVASLAMAGCSGGTLSGIASVKPPEHSNIVSEYNAFVTQWNKLPPSAGDMETSREYVTRGYDLAERSCVIYFARLKQLRNETTFISDTLVSLFAAGGIIAGLAGAAAPVLVALFAGAGFVPSTIQNFNSVYLLAEVGDDLYPSINQSMARFRAGHPADGSTPVVEEGENVDKVQVSKWTAQQLVQQHAALCSLPAMTSMVKGGIANLKLKLDLNTGIVSAAKAPAAPGTK